MSSLDDMHLFVAVAKHKSFVKAARDLGLATSTVSLRIQKLERHIGLQLLNRTTRKVELTEAGGLYFDQASQIIDEAKAIHKSLRHMLSDPSGIIKISMPVDFSYQVFAPLMPLFHQRFPNIKLDIDTGARMVDLIGEPFDLALRMGEPKNPNLIARRLRDYPFHLYASPHYLQTYGTPKDLNDLAHHHCLAFAQESWRLFNDKQEKTVDFDSPMICTNLGLAERLAKQDMGIALLPDFFARDNNLTMILPDWSGKPMPLYALTATRLLPKKVQVLIDFLKASL